MPKQGIMPYMNIIGFAFRGNISSKALNELSIKTKFEIESDNKVIDLFIEEMFKLNPKYILGLGMYSGRDKDKLRIETQCIYENKILKINNFLNPSGKSKFANGIGNSYCNYVSGKIMNEIYSKKLETKYTFIHIPKSFDIKVATEEIEEILRL
jgi:pyrrolidone-carboxylate peptidase